MAPLTSLLLLGVALAPPALAGVSREQQEAELEALREHERARDVLYWEDLVAEAPEDVTLRLGLGNSYALNDRLRDAVREYRKVLREYPDYKIAWNNLGSAYRALGKSSQAVRAYRKALELDPQYALVYYNLGVVYDREGFYQRAIEHYGLAFRYDPGLIEVRNNPQVVTNRHVSAVLLNNYLESAGAIALPLEPALPPGPRE
jgi:tetratricopeptide (TPR) repeat protein